MTEMASAFVSNSPSFDSYSSAASHRLERIAARVISELQDAEAHNQPEEAAGDPADSDAEPNEFEFTFVCREPDASPISADELFSNGQIRPLFPIYNRDLVFHRDGDGDATGSAGGGSEVRRAAVRLPLRKLMIQDDEEGGSARAAAAGGGGDDLEGIPEGTYCVWRPRSVPPSPERCKKSKSTGSSWRWRFRDLLHRSSSDGKDTFVFLSPAVTGRKVGKSANDSKADAPPPCPRPPETKASPGKWGGFPTAAYAKKGEERRRSYLPYRQDIVGFFANVNGLSRTIQPF